MTPLPVDSIASWSQLGAIGFLVTLLVYLLKQSNEERRETNERYLTALTSTVTKNNETITQVSASITELMAAVHQQTQVHTEEHKSIVDAIGKLSNREFNGKNT